jgi:hypothetical protein
VVPSASASVSASRSSNLEPDFINLQAIIARSLTMNLAYPQIQDAMSELLGAVPFTPNITIISVEKLGFVGVEMAFGTLQHVFQTLYRGRAIVLGYMKGIGLEIAVPQHLRITWEEGDRIVAIIRRQLGDDLDDDDDDDDDDDEEGHERSKAEFKGKRGSKATPAEAKAIARAKEGKAPGMSLDDLV